MFLRTFALLLDLTFNIFFSHHALSTSSLNIGAGTHKHAQMDIWICSSCSLFHAIPHSDIELNMSVPVHHSCCSEMTYWVTHYYLVQLKLYVVIWIWTATCVGGCMYRWMDGWMELTHFSLCFAICTVKKNYVCCTNHVQCSSHSIFLAFYYSYYMDGRVNKVEDFLKTRLFDTLTEQITKVTKVL